jgi:hypothetical protein
MQPNRMIIVFGLNTGGRQRDPAIDIFKQVLSFPLGRGQKRRAGTLTLRTLMPGAPGSTEQQEGEENYRQCAHQT